MTEAKIAYLVAILKQYFFSFKFFAWIWLSFVYSVVFTTKFRWESGFLKEGESMEYPLGTDWWDTPYVLMNIPFQCTLTFGSTDRQSRLRMWHTINLTPPCWCWNRLSQTLVQMSCMLHNSNKILHKKKEEREYDETNQNLVTCLGCFQKQWESLDKLRWYQNMQYFIQFFSKINVLLFFCHKSTFVTIKLKIHT